MPRTVSIQVRFILRKNTAKPDAVCPIEAVIYKNKVDYRFAIGMGAKVADWDSDKQRFLTNIKNAFERKERTQLNDLLDKWEVELKAIWNEYHRPDFSGSPKRQMTRQGWIMLVNERLGKTKAVSEMPTFSDFVKKEIETKINDWKGAKRNADWKKNNTLQTLFTFYKLILLYQKTQGKIEWANINAQTVQSFQAWLFRPCAATVKIKLAEIDQTREVKKKAYEKGSANTHLSFFKSFVKSAAVKKYVSSSTVEDVRLVGSTKGSPDKFFYHWREVKTLFETDLSGQAGAYRLHKCRILMAVGFFTGMREGDWHRFSKDYILEMENEKYLNLTTTKKGAKVGIPLSPVFQKILGITGFTPNGFQTNSDLNQAMKELAKVAGINRIVDVNSTEGGIKHEPVPTPFHEVTSSHDCRRTFGQMMLMADVPFDTVRRLLAHRTQAQTGDYVENNTFSGAEHNNPAEKAALKAFLNGEIDLTNFAKDHENYLKKLAEMPVKPKKKA